MLLTLDQSYPAFWNYSTTLNFSEHFSGRKCFRTNHSHRAIDRSRHLILWATWDIPLETPHLIILEIVEFFPSQLFHSINLPIQSERARIWGNIYSPYIDVLFSHGSVFSLNRSLQKTRINTVKHIYIFFFKFIVVQLII